MIAHRKIVRRAVVTALLVAPLSLTACGFQPLHAPNASGAISAMDINFIQTQARGETAQKIEFLMRQSILDRMGPGAAENVLSLTPRLTQTAVGVTQDNINSRYDLRLTVDFTVSNGADGSLIYKDSVIAFNSFSAPRDPYGLIAAQSNAEESLARDASDRVILKIATYSKTAL